MMYVYLPLVYILNPAPTVHVHMHVNDSTTFCILHIHNVMCVSLRFGIGFGG